MGLVPLPLPQPPQSQLSPSHLLERKFFNTKPYKSTMLPTRLLVQELPLEVAPPQLLQPPLPLEVVPLPQPQPPKPQLLLGHLRKISINQPFFMTIEFQLNFYL